MQEIIKNKISKTLSKIEGSNQKGVTLVMALLILSLTMTASISLSRVISGEIRITVNSINSLSAFYAADSAVEKALYYIEYSRKTRDADPLSELKGKKFNIFDSQQSFSFVDVSTSTADFTFYDVGTSTPARVDIVDAAGNLPALIDWSSGASPPLYYELDWSIDTCFPNHASDKLEITTYSFTNIFDVEIDKDLVVCNCVFRAVGDANYDKCGGSSATPFTKTILKDRFYRFSFKPLDGVVKLMSFNAYASGGTLLGISSDTLVTVDGLYKNSIYRLNVEVPSLLSASNLFSYVIFSEEGLKKDI